MLTAGTNRTRTLSRLRSIGCSWGIAKLIVPYRVWIVSTGSLKNHTAAEVSTIAANVQGTWERPPA